jgi:hypothetical protein
MYSLPFFGMTGGGNTAPMFDNVDDYLQFLGASLWLDAADPTTVDLVADTARVERWRGKIGNNRDATQGNTNNQPIYQNSAIEFDGVSKFFTVSSFTDSRIVSAFVVASVKSFHVGNFLANGSDSGSGGGLFLRLQSSSFLFTGQNFSPTTLSSPPDLNRTYIIGGIERETTRNIYLNGVTPNTITTVPVARATTTPRIGSDAFSQHLNGSISEIILIDAAISDSDRQIIEGYLAHKWGLVADLPANHPYKSLAPAIPTLLRIEATTPFLDIETEAQTFTFTVTRGGNLNKESSVTYTTTATNRLAVVATDFVGDIFPSGTVTFAVGETTKTITIQLKQSDSSKEFAVTLSGAVNADIASGSATAIGFSNLEGYLVSLNTVLWLDAADPTTVDLVADTARVERWRGKIGNNRDATQGNTNNQPIYQNSAIEFDGVSKFFTVSSFTDSRIVSAFVVASVKSFHVGNFLANGSDSGSGGGLFLRLQSSSFLFTGQNFSPTTLSSPPDLNRTYIIGGIERETTRNIYLNGVTPNTITTVPVARATTTPRIGSDAFSQHLNGSISEIILIDAAISDSDRQIIEGYLAHKWGLVADLPANHPYKSVAPF